MERIGEDGVKALCRAAEQHMEMEGLKMKCVPVRGSAWMPWKIEVTGPSRRSQMSDQYRDEQQTGVFSPRQLRLALKSRSYWGFWGKMVV